MKKLLHTLASILILFSPVLTQSDWHTYPVRSISSQIEEHSKHGMAGADMSISAKPFPSKTLVTFTGKKRPIDKQTKLFIKL